MFNYSGILVDGNGGISAGGIKLVLDVEEIEDRPLITKKLITYLETVLSTQNKKDSTDPSASNNLEGIINEQRN